MTSTRLQVFIRANRIKPSVLSRESGYSRQFLWQLRHTGFEPARHAMARITDAASRILNRPVYCAELFALGEMDEAFAAMRGIEDLD